MEASADPYAVLGVARDAPAEEIRSAYVALARRNHPDVSGGDPASDARMRRVNEAWAVLSDADARALVDQRLARGRVATPPTRPSPTHRDSDVEPQPRHDYFDGDDTPITSGELPVWMRLGAPGAFVAGIFAVILGVMFAGGVVAQFGLVLLFLSAMLFALSPFVVLIRSRSHR